jgi:hypothetical protein
MTDSKVCSCGAVFFRTGNFKEAQWRQTTRCQKCRKSSGKHPPAERKMGMYTVNNPILDKFIYSR